MKINRKRYQAQFLNAETLEVKSFDLFAHDDCETGTSGRGLALKAADEIAKENALTALWSRVVPVRATYSWSKKDGCTLEKVVEITENEPAEE